MSIDRRAALKVLAAAGLVRWPAAFGQVPGDPDLELRLTAAHDRVPIWSGPATDVLRFSAEVLRGQRDAVRPSGGYLGPVLDLRRGERVRIVFVNRTGEPSIVHWHGMIVPELADGHPRFAIASGAEYVYDFEVRNPAGTYLYHPHPHGRTGAQVYAGLAGLIIVREPGEAALGLPSPADELDLVLQDRRVSRGNQFVFRRTMMDEMTGVLGDRVLVSGMPDARFGVARRPYRLRIANVSNARIYKLAWSDERPLHVIATDSGLLSRAEGVQVRPYVVLAPFERIELLEDFGTRRGGDEVALISRSFNDGMMGGMMGRGSMMGGMMGGGQGEELLIARFSIAHGDRQPGAALQLAEPQPPARASGHELYTRIAFRRMRGTFNGRVFDHHDMTAVADDERLPVGAATLWTFDNDGSDMMAMPHPIHIHGVRFRVVERTGSAAPADLREGLIDVGYKDTFLIFPGERVRAWVAPTEPGLFMYHCHNLEHEDGGMMRNCRFV